MQSSTLSDLDAIVLEAMNNADVLEQSIMPTPSAFLETFVWDAQAIEDFHADSTTEAFEDLVPQKDTSLDLFPCISDSVSWEDTVSLPMTFSNVDVIEPQKGFLLSYCKSMIL